MGLQEQFDDILHQPGDRPVASRRKTFGAKPRLWDTWIEQDGGKDTVNEFEEIKVRCIGHSLLLKSHLYCCDP